MTDPYSILGVPRTASEDAIRKAFRKLAKKHHPDLNPGDKVAEAKFKEITQANDLLSDPEKRRRFDAGEIDAAGQEMPPRGFYRDQAGSAGGRKYERAGGHESFVDMGGIFAEMFGNRRGFGLAVVRPVRPKASIPAACRSPTHCGCRSWSLRAAASSGSACPTARRSTSTFPRVRPTARLFG